MISNVKHEEKKLGLTALIAVCLALIFVLSVYSPDNVNPRNTDWVIRGGGDNFQHYIGWRFFRHATLNRHFLFMRNLGFPRGTSVIVTDSNPLFCLLFKCFDRLLSENFQFNGIWIVCSYVLSAFFAVLIAYHLTENMYVSLAAASFVILNPVILQRALIHDTLTAHWLILGAIWLWINYRRKFVFLGWSIIIGLTMLIHMYFLPQVLFIFALQLLWMIRGREKFSRIIVCVAAVMGTMVVGYYGLGYNHILPGRGSFGELSLNLNAFFNADGTSRFLPALPTSPLQYEGFNYFGLGLLLLCAWACICSGRNQLDDLIWVGVPCLLMLLFAASNIGMFGLREIYHISISEEVASLLSVFRSSGRLAWPFYYLALFYALRTRFSREKPLRKWAVFPLMFLVALQFIDFSDYIIECARRFRTPGNDIIIPELILPDSVQNLYIGEVDAKMMDGFALYAANHALNFNLSSNAREIRPIFGGDVVVIENLRKEDIGESDWFIVPDTEKYRNFIESCADLARPCGGLICIGRNQK